MISSLPPLRKPARQAGQPRQTGAPKPVGLRLPDAALPDIVFPDAALPGTALPDAMPQNAALSNALAPDRRRSGIFPPGPLPLLLAVCMLLFANAAPAAVVMDTGDSRITLDRNSGAAMSPGNAAPGQDSRGVWSTPPRPAPDSTPEELPYGIVPEVYVPWFQRQSNIRPPVQDGPGWRPPPPGQDGPGWRPSPPGQDGPGWRPSPPGQDGRWDGRPSPPDQDGPGWRPSPPGQDGRWDGRPSRPGDWKGNDGPGGRPPRPDARQSSDGPGRPSSGNRPAAERASPAPRSGAKERIRSDARPPASTIRPLDRQADTIPSTGTRPGPDSGRP